MSAEYELKFPLNDKEALNWLEVGDKVLVNGIIVTGRDMAHKYFVENPQDELIQKELMPLLKQGALYHCGPIIEQGTLRVISAGPTTSSREESYQKEVLSLFDLAAVIGKGGMGERTLAGLGQTKAVYLNAVGGAGSYYAQRLKVLGVFKEAEFGMPEAMWVLEVKNFFTVVTMDFRGNTFYDRIREDSSGKLKDLYLP
ncbi:MAG: fumarate hydrolyase [Spirochaetae bacterium HGW-Spirochaetae-6]|nr:MAG: fumarate hydrolyase [Spirochaetae bacterium HGW-Spirochaetae-6]